MRLKNIISICLLAFISIIPMIIQGCAQYNPPSSGLFTPESLKQFDVGNLPECIEAQLERAAAEIPEAESLVKEENESNEACRKRLEIAKRLENNTRNYYSAEGKENLVLAWQGAEELRIFLDYFKREAKHRAKLKSLPAPKVISVKKFGAKGDGKTDDGPAIQRALDAAASFKCPVTVKIPAGTYIIGNHHRKKVTRYKINDPLPDGGAYPRQHVAPKSVHLLLKNVKNITIEGEDGTKLRFLDPVAIAIRVLGGENITLKNFSIDYVNLPFTQGKIKAIDNQTGALTFQVDSGYPLPDIGYFLKAPSRRLTPHDANGRFCLKTYRIGKVKKVNDNTFEIYPFLVKPGTQMWKPQELGLKATIIARYDAFKYDAYAVDLRQCKFCSIENVIVYSSPAGGFRTMLTYAVSLIGCRVEILPDSGRLMSTNADGCQNNGLIGAFIKNCAFNSSEDDGININSSTFPVEEISADRKMMSPAINGGALFVDSVNGQVHAIAQLNNGASVVPLSKLIRTRKHVGWDQLSHQEKSAMGYWSGTNEKFKLRPDRIISIPPVTTGAVISGCEFHNIRGLGIQVTSPNTIIENCKFSGNSGSGININAMVGWGMVYNTHNVVARNCEFRDYRREAVSCRYHPIGKGILTPHPFCNLYFGNNTFFQDKAGSMQIWNCSGVKITGNSFYKSQPSAWVICNKNSIGVNGDNNNFLYPNASIENSFRPASLGSQFKNNHFINSEYHKDK